MHEFQKKADTIVCIASGPSLTLQQVETVKNSGHFTIVVNNNYEIAPWAHVLYAADISWWRYHYPCVKRTPFRGELWSLEATVKGLARQFPEVPEKFHSVELNRNAKNRLGEDCFTHGSNSGFHAVNLAYLFGAKKIVLIGYDHQHTYGKRHWFGDHDKKHFRKNAEDVDIWLENMNILVKELEAKGIDVINCSIETAIESRRSTLEKEL